MQAALVLIARPCAVVALNAFFVRCLALSSFLDVLLFGPFVGTFCAMVQLILFSPLRSFDGALFSPFVLFPVYFCLSILSEGCPPVWFFLFVAFSPVWTFLFRLCGLRALCPPFIVLPVCPSHLLGFALVCRWFLCMRCSRLCDPFCVHRSRLLLVLPFSAFRGLSLVCCSRLCGPSFVCCVRLFRFFLSSLFSPSGSFLCVCRSFLFGAFFVFCFLGPFWVRFSPPWFFFVCCSRLF